MTRAALIALTAALWASPAHPQSCREDAVIVFDASESMSHRDGITGHVTSRVDDARQAMNAALPEAEMFRRLGLVSMGGSKAAGCASIVEMEPADRAATAIMGQIAGFTSHGSTPVSRAVGKAAEMVAPAGTVVVVTDGFETCSGDPCSRAAQIAETWPEMVVHVVTFRSRGNSLSCLPDQTGGLHLHTDDVGELVAALRATVGCPLFGEVTP